MLKEKLEARYTNSGSGTTGTTSITSYASMVITMISTVQVGHHLVTTSPGAKKETRPTNSIYIM